MHVLLYTKYQISAITLYDGRLLICILMDVRQPYLWIADEIVNNIIQHIIPSFVCDISHLLKCTVFLENHQVKIKILYKLKNYYTAKDR